ncbi:hypothetical protein TNCV_1214331 [Trichonephila clavipes]|nr:hypothetical protein TNCV_1214331 [Trichonephila clavipes]
MGRTILLERRQSLAPSATDWPRPFARREIVCGISFTYRVNNRGELKTPCGRPLLIGRGERAFYLYPIGEKAMNGLDQGEGKSSRMSLISKPSCFIFAGEKKKSIPCRGLVLGKATVNQLRYSEQLVNCRALGSKTAPAEE